MTETTGHVWLVGAGPGDPGLLTLAGAEALRRAELVLYDALAPDALLALCDPAAEMVSVGKRAGDHSASQDEITALLVRHGSEGKRVVRLKGGDPFVFGRGGEEALALAAAGIPFTIVPGSPLLLPSPPMRASPSPTADWQQTSPWSPGAKARRPAPTGTPWPASTRLWYSWGPRDCLT